jgi:hypothetical protein
MDKEIIIDRLKEVAKRDNAIFLSKKGSKTTFICNCKKEATKNSSDLIRIGRFMRCVDCSKYKSSEIVQQIINNKAITNESVILEFKNNNVYFICKCGNRHNKRSYSITNGNEYLRCIKCVDRFSETVTENVESIAKSCNAHIVSRGRFTTYTCKCGTLCEKKTSSFTTMNCYMRCRDCYLEHLKEYSKSESTKNKKCQTNMDKYGVNYACQSIEILQKQQENSLKFKKYIMPSGEIRLIQGYEHYALNDLLKEYYEKDIITNRKDIPKIQYLFDNSTRYYFPDIYIPLNNKIIEVKSIWTYNKNLSKNIAKQEACIANSYLFEFWIYNEKGNRVNFI